ncbi:MAG TPA: hypothetical protein VHO94_05995 [Oscillospiraceae bacterium]|nr:hypothetical protein [Oscillospiraceae bacterium]
MNNSIRVAFCGIITALGTILMFATGLISIGTYALPALAGVLSILIVVEMGAKWAWPVYVATSVLSLLLAADKEAAILYAVFFGFYPILKAYIERLHKKALVYLIKSAAFIAAMILDFFIIIYILRVPQASFTIMGVYLPWVFLAVGIVVFYIYDFAVSGLVVLYYQRFHKTLGRWLHTK